ncbi:CAP domain-containing protein [Sphingomonas arenae]|uniref:CAP domain-containing protein n=1 Tax=Sphingomonas arenae TaxID=2812555 RepID=UPI00196879C5|nr:CAP domain-containing protein [Sphingomonas arenae]
MDRPSTFRPLGVIALCLAAPFLLGSIGPRTSFDDRILAAHNRERDAIGVEPLSWDTDLAIDARRWATRLAESGRFEHSPDEPGAPIQGENLWGGTPGYYLPEDMVGLWIAEKQHFQPGVFPNNSRTGQVADVSHYTQLAWRTSGKVGCALAAGESEEVLVCRYSSAGNIVGSRPF